MGINARNFEPGDLGPVRIRALDGASTWKYLDQDRTPARIAIPSTSSP